MKTLGVIGAGTMGAGIAQSAALAGLDVFLHDISLELLSRATERIGAELTKSVEKGKLTQSEGDKALRRITTTPMFDGVASCELVIEAAIEKLDVKQEIFGRLEKICSTQTIIASNTSSLSITAMSSRLAHPERTIGIHFFNPVHLMKLVEVIKGHKTSPDTTERALAFVNQLTKTPVVVTDTPGFIVNRVARPFYGEALRLLGEGVATVEEIDRIVKLEGGFRMGPFELMDLIGIDINFAVTQSMYEQSFGEPRYRPHIIQKRMVDAGLLGRKTKRGFYDYNS